VLLLILFALIAGIGTALSPCVLPVLPAVLAGGITGGRGRPLGVATGLVLSFTFATVALIYLLDALGLPADFARNLAIATLALFGVTLLVPALSDRVEAGLSRLVGGPRGDLGSEGFVSGLLLGISLGFVYAPCAGPILAAVVTASASQPFSAEKLLVALAYGAGSGLVIYALLLGGRRLAARFRPVQARVNAAMGVLMIAFALALVTDLDLKFQRFLADDAPTILSTPTQALEESSAVAGDLAEVRGGHGPVAEQGGASEADAGERLPVLGRAPGFRDTQRWFNSRPLSLAGLRGKVVLVDFWTYTCINCIRTLPHVEAWWQRYRSRGLVVVGVHTPEFPFEREASNVSDAISEFGLRYPVVQDNDYGTWNAFGNQFWPAKYLIDAAGNVRYVHFGEGSYGTTERAIRSLLAERGDGRLGAETRVRAQVPSPEVRTPESYLGLARAQRFALPPRPGTHDYRGPEALRPNQLAYVGRWRVGGEGATASGRSALELDFHARRVFLVLGSPAGPRRVGVLLDGHPIPDRLAGSDVHAATLTVDRQRLYSLVDLPGAGRHQLKLRFPPGVSGYAFTFG
jgi:cytochrome c biogenesis protein CcdA/thiol-disulfide isomerase/thioredoxin